MRKGILKEYVFGSNDFYQPKEIIGKKAVALLIVRLILLEPGTDPMRPEMGVGLVSKYRYMFPEKLADLKKDISNQLQIFLPQYQMTPIKLSVEDSKLIIEITVDDSVYKYVMDEQEDNKITLTELMEQDFNV